MNFRVGCAAPLGKADNSRAALARVGPGDIAQIFEAPEQLVHCLFAHAGALGQRARTNSIRSRKLQHRHMWQAQFIEAGCVEFPDDTAMDGLGRDAQQGTNEQLAER